ncbi:hypothetical protein JAAARDRAFT_52097 [Jaapia argillacea MUCL 33604]|uniref:Uncharacterized protein n=1 Tax=Jaapia argillacea MUCL 33604 TaxID=933084 RepID=A0A067QAL5_9AGAM|nr:hypothetical protein JAAARDRAFT_52097 [Jaapia argillacea MUCL 33604]
MPAHQRPPHWVETWQTDEETGWLNNKYVPVNLHAKPLEDRLYLAASAFARLVKWPSPPTDVPPKHRQESSLKELWHQFTYWIGILTYQPDPDRLTNARHWQNDFRPKRTFKQEKRLDLFTLYPQISVKAFLSSFFEERGYTYERRRCHEAVVLVGTFLRFLKRIDFYRSEGTEMSDLLDEALEVVGTASEELPATRQISTLIPCSFSQGCTHIFVEPVPPSYPSVTPSLEVLVCNWADPDSLPWDSWELEEEGEDVEDPLMHALSRTHKPGPATACLKRRKIVGIHPPRPGDKPSFTSSESIEQGILHRFGCIVLEAWPTSRDVCDPSLSPGSSASTPHGTSDIITVPVDPQVLDSLRIGMILEGVWVGLIPNSDAEKNTSGGDDENKGNGTSEVPKPIFHYLERIYAVQTSYHTIIKDVQEDRRK